MSDALAAARPSGANMTLRERAYQWVYETKEIVCLSGDEPRFIAAYEAGWTAALEEAAKHERSVKEYFDSINKEEP
jgi:hypothetical protein